MSNRPEWQYWLVLVITVLAPIPFAPFTLTVIQEKPKVANGIVTIATVAMPFTIIIMAELYVWASLLELLGFPQGRNFRQMLDGQEQQSSSFR